MGYYTEYLNKQLSLDQITAERKKQLAEISKLRDDRDVLVIASDLTKPNAPTSIDYDDLMPFNDQLSTLSGTKLDLILREDQAK